MNPQTKAEFDKLLVCGIFTHCHRIINFFFSVICIKIQSIKGNNKCIDCDGPNPKWASVNNGCFICINCAGNHRSMGVHISFVRSITMDSWSKVQLKRIQYGGNAKLKSFWKEQKFPKGLTPQQRLDNNAMDKYRENLLQKAKNESTNPIGFIGYEKRVIRQRKFDSKSMQGFGNTENIVSNNQSVAANYLYLIIAIAISYYLYHYFNTY